MTTPSHLSIHLRLLGMAALWGVAWPLGRLVGQSIPPITASGLRFMIASIALLLWLYRYNRFSVARALTARQWLNLALASSAGILGYSSFFMLSLQVVPAGKASIIVAVNPAVTLLMAALIFKERLNGIICLGMVLAAVGATVAITDGNIMEFIQQGGLGSGILLLLGCVACWVTYTLLGRVLLSGIDALTTTTICSTLGGLMLVLASFPAEGLTGWNSVLSAPASAWISLIVMALACTTLAYSWYFDGVKALGAGASAGYITLVPVFGLLFSGLILKEHLGLSLLTGGLIAISGMTLMNLGRR